MAKLFSSKEIIKVLLDNGFLFVSQRGSHCKYRNKNKVVIIPHLSVMSSILLSYQDLDNFVDSSVKIYRRSIHYAEKFMPCSQQNTLRLIRHNTLNLTLEKRFPLEPLDQYCDNQVYLLRNL